MKRKIVKSPSPILRMRALDIEKFDERLSSLAKEMTEIMDSSGGIGLAAPQVSSALAFVIIRVDSERVFPLANPRIEEKEGESLALEGCLSLPGLQVPVLRSERIHLKAQDLFGEEFSLDLTGITSRIAQHEIDHLQGRLIIDKLWSPNNPSRGHHLKATG